MRRRVAVGVATVINLGLVAVVLVTSVGHSRRRYDRGCEAVVAKQRYDHPGDATFDPAARACQRHADYLERLVSQP